MQAPKRSCSALAQITSDASKGEGMIRGQAQEEVKHLVYVRIFAIRRPALFCYFTVFSKKQRAEGQMDAPTSLQDILALVTVPNNGEAKTKLCNLTCGRTARACNFAHSAKELRPPSMFTRVCVRDEQIPVVLPIANFRRDRCELSGVLMGL